MTFEKETAAKTALLLDNTQLGKSQVHVTSASNIDQVAASAGSTNTATEHEDHISQDDKPRARVVAEYLAHGYALSDNVIQQAINLDSKHGISSRFTSALQNFDNKYKVTDKAKETDSKYGVSDKAYNAWAGLNSYFEKALDTPTGQKVRDFYAQGDRQVRDVHNEARRLADLKSGKAEGQGSGLHEFEPEPVKGTSKTVCSCGGKDGVCGCAPGKCACASCSKSSAAAVTEVKEAAQATGQSLPKETFGASTTS